MALTNVLVQQSIANVGQPKALLVDARGQPLITDSKDISNKPVANEESARETSLNIQKMVDLLEVIAKGVSGRGNDELKENTDSKMNFGNMLGYYGSMIFFKLFDALFSGIAAAARFIFARVLPFLAKGFIKIIAGFFGFLAGLPAGLAAAVIGGITVAIAGFVRAFKDAFEMYKSGGSFFEIVGAFVEGFFKGALNFVFGIVDWVANLFGLDLPDNLGDIIVDGIKNFFKGIGDYISELPERLGKMLSGFLNNLGIPEFKVFGVSIGPFYPFRKSETSTPQEDTVGSEKPPTKTIMPKSNVEGLNSDRTLDSDGMPSKVPVTPVSPLINKTVTGESVSIRRAPKEMSKEDAMALLNKNPWVMSHMNLGIKYALADGKGEPSVSDLLGGYGDPTWQRNNKMEGVIEAVYRVYPEVISKVFNRSVGGKDVRDLIESTEDSGTRAKIADEALSGIVPTKKNNLISPGTPSDVGTSIMNASAEAENAKSAASSNVIINAPSSTVNAPKESNLMTSKNVRNDENTLSKYVGSLYGSNI